MSHTVRIFLYRYGDIALLDNYVKALTGSGMKSMISDDISMSQYCHGLLLCGGCDSDPTLYGQENTGCRAIDRPRDDAEIELVRRFTMAKRPILGICRGHQLLNFVFDGSLIQDMDTKDLHEELDGHDQLHATVIAPHTFLWQLYGNRATVTSAHHQAIGQLSPSFQPLQWTSDGTVEGMVHRTLPIIGVQWHPERQSFARRREDAADGAPLFSYFRTLCEKEANTSAI